MKLFCEDEKLAYYASAFGEVWSLRKRDGRWHELKPFKNNDGYTWFHFFQNGVRKKSYVHRAVFEAFHGPILKGFEINHINTVRDDNRLENLEVVTPSGNQNHPPSREHQREAHRWQMKAVLDVTTGVVYESTKEASRQTGLHSGHISACCLGKRNHTGGHVFCYAS